VGKKKKTLLLVFVIIVFFVGVALFLRRGSKSFLVEVETLEFSTIEQTVEIYGTIEPKEYFEMILPLQQKITEVFVVEGQEVKKSQVLAKLDPSSLEIQREKFLIQQLLLKRDLEDLISNQSDKERMDLQNVLVASRSLMEASRERMEDAKKSLDNKKQEYARAQIPFEEVQRSELVFLDAKAQYESGRKTYESSQNNKNSFEKDLEKRVQNLEAQVQLSELDIRELENRIQDTVIESEMDGLLAVFGLKENEQVTSQNNKISIIDQKRLKLVASVPQEDAVQIKQGQKASIVLKSTSKTYEAEVSSVKEIANTRGEAQNQLPRLVVEISIVPPLEGLTVGFEGDANVVVKKLEDVLAIQRTNLLKDDEGNPYVWMVKGDRVSLQFVKTGLSTDLEVEILEGLNLGDLVIVNPSPEITDGSVVQIKKTPSGEI
jgi:HlyD family secretion protein